MTTAARPRKRKRGQGSVYKRKDGRWVAAMPRSTGIRPVYCATEREANRALARLQAGIVERRTSRETVASLMASYLDHLRTQVAPQSLGVYERHARLYIVPRLGARRLAALTPRDLAEFQASLPGNPGGIAQIMQTLRAALNLAVTWELIDRNPAQRVRPPRRPAALKDDGMTAERALAILDAVRDSRYAGVIGLALWPGLRIGEVLGLRWEDVDERAGVLRVRRALGRLTAAERLHPGEVYGLRAPKRGSSREIPIDDFIGAVLARQRQVQAEERSRAETWQDNGLIFPTVTGEPMPVTTVRSAFDRALERAGLPHTKLHDLRAGAATLMAAESVNPRVAQQRLGHANLQTTLAIYTHTSPEMLRDAGEKVARRLLRG